MNNPRFIAVKILCEIEQNNSFSNIALLNNLKKYELNRLDAAFVSSLVYGVLQRKLTLDYIVELFSSKPVKKLHPLVAFTLRIAIYQMLFMDKVPESAAVNESVKIIKSSKQNFASGFTNAILRKIAINKDDILEKINNLTDLSIKYSCEINFINELINDYGFEIADGFLKSTLDSPKTYGCVNSRLIDIDSLIDKLNDKGILCNKCSVNGAFSINSIGDIQKLDEFKNGLFHIQDLSSQIAISKLDILDGMSVLDVCASPGGKSFTASGYLKNSGNVLSCDIYSNRVSLIESGAKTLKLNNIKAIVNDASVFNSSLGSFDRIICDVPCSGYGVIRRKPEIRYKNINEFTNLPDLQLNILNTSAKYLKNDGKIMYSTCTVRKAENRAVVDKFLMQNNNFEIICEQTLMPNINDCDGFYYCILKRK